MAHTILYVGVDLATTSTKTAICVLGEDEGERLSVVRTPFAPTKRGAIGDALDVDHVANIITGLMHDHPTSQVVVGVDAPFGWPSAFTEEIGKHSAANPHSFCGARDKYRLRATDRFVRDRLGLTPLSPSVDKIGAVALVAAALVCRLRSASASFEIALCRKGAEGGKHDIIEVYPEATLSSWFHLRAFPRYKKDRSIRDKLQQAVMARLREQSIDLSPLTFNNDHEIDAFISALTAREYAHGRCICPTEARESKVDVEREGWIWLPRSKAAV